MKVKKVGTGDGLGKGKLVALQKEGSVGQFNCSENGGRPVCGCNEDTIVEPESHSCSIQKREQVVKKLCEV